MTLVAQRFSLVIALCAFLSGCAQTGPPLPPSLELPKPPSDLRAVRKGNQVTLAWSESARTTDRQTVRYLGPTLVCRSLDAEMKECGNPVAELAPPARAARAADAFQPLSQMFTDTLPGALQQQNPLGDVSYAVQVLNRDRRTAGLSNRATVSAMPTLPAPADFHAELSGSGVTFTWTSAGASSPQGMQYRYRIYRRDESSGKVAMASEVPAGEAGPIHAQDASFEWEKTYSYRITAVSIATRAEAEVQVEGDDSAAVHIVAHDVFPPAVPSGLQAVYSGEGQKPFVDVIWAPVTDADLAGYAVYRRDPAGAPVKLNATLVKSPSYRDSMVEPGKTYSYSVSATDLRGNESARSEEASENVP